MQLCFKSTHYQLGMASLWKFKAAKMTTFDCTQAFDFTVVFALIRIFLTIPTMYVVSKLFTEFSALGEQN